MTVANLVRHGCKSKLELEVELELGLGLELELELELESELLFERVPWMDGCKYRG